MSKAKIMIVEDESLVGLDIQNHLDNLGYEVTSISAEAREALDRLKQEAPDLILMDIRLRGEMNGIDAAREIRDRFGVPVLFLTAFADSDIISRASETGAYGYLLKPFKNRELQAMVEVALSKHRIEQECRQLDERVQRAQKYESLQAMAGGIAHQFNSALNVVLSSIGVAMNNLPRGTLVQNDLKEAAGAARQAADLSMQMLACSGHGIMNFRILDLCAFLEQEKQLIEELLSPSVILNLELADGLPNVMADPEHLKQILTALVGNAIEAIGKRSGVVTIRITARECSREYLTAYRSNGDLKPGLYILMEVVDTGCGMGRKTAAKVFDPFYSTKSNGRGLGLATTLGIVQAHRGAIQISSNLGIGTRVKVLFPITKCNHGDSDRVLDPNPEWDETI